MRNSKYTIQQHKDESEMNKTISDMISYDLKMVANNVHLNCKARHI